MLHLKFKKDAYHLNGWETTDVHWVWTVQQQQQNVTMRCMRNIHGRFWLSASFLNTEGNGSYYSCWVVHFEWIHGLLSPPAAEENHAMGFHSTVFFHSKIIHIS